MNGSQQMRLRAADSDVTQARQAYDEARADREIIIREVAAEGISYRDIAEQISLSYQRVAQILGVEDDRLDIMDTIEAFCTKCGAEPGARCQASPVDELGVMPSLFHSVRYDRREKLHAGDPHTTPLPGEPGHIPGLTDA